MPHMTFTAGQVLTASQVNTYLMNQAVDVVTSTTRPSSPTEGRAVWETDTDKLHVYTTATTGWVPPWNLPWGVQAVATMTANQSSISSTEIDITGLSVTFTAVANRRYRSMLALPIFSNGGGSTTTFGAFITDGSNTRKGQTNLSVPAVSDAHATVWAWETGLSAGSVTRKGRVITTVGGSSGVLIATASVPAFLLVEDVGPSAAPA